MTAKDHMFALFGLSRPIILAGMAMIPVAGIAMALAQGYTLQPDRLIWGFTSLLLMCMSVNFVNEYADHETDSLTEPTRYSGGSGVIPQGRAPRWLALAAGWATALISVAIGLLGWASGILPALAVAIIIGGGFFGWMYSMPPLKLAWNGGAELTNAILGGIILPVFGYALLAGTASLPVAAAFIPYALLLFGTAMGTTYADRDADRQVGKRTLATWLSDTRLRQIYLLMALLSLLSLFLLVGWSLPPQVTVASLVALPGIIGGVLAYTRVINPHATARASMMLIFAQTTAWFWLATQPTL